MPLTHQPVSWPNFLWRKLLKHLVVNTMSFNDNSKYFFDKIKNLLVDWDIMMSFDMMFVYTKTPIDKVLKVVSNFWTKTTDLVRLCVDTTFL